MSTMAQYVEDYLRLRRALGFKLERAGWLLPQFVAYLEAAGSATLTSNLAIAWAQLERSARPNNMAQRLAIVRGFARYLQAIDPATEVPPPGVFPSRRHRPTPYPVVAERHRPTARWGANAGPTPARRHP